MSRGVLALSLFTPLPPSLSPLVLMAIVEWFGLTNEALQLNISHMLTFIIDSNKFECAKDRPAKEYVIINVL